MAKMSRRTKFAQHGLRSADTTNLKIYWIFMVPKPTGSRLFSTMQNMNMNWQTSEQPGMPAAYGVEKEPKLKLSVEMRNQADVIIVHCQGRVVYRDEAAALSRVVGEVLHQGSKLVLELGGVTAMDSAGIGELVLLQTWAQDRKAELKCAGANTVVRTLLDLTNLDSVLEVYPTLDAALESFAEERVCADC
jgi:anti-sigma B factor antagonist